MQITVKSNIEQLTKSIRGFADQIPFVTAQALTKTAIDARQAVQGAIIRDIDKPTPFTIRAPRFKAANKRNLTALVFLADKPAEYLRYVIEGGTRNPGARAIAIGFGVKRNQYGNVPRKAINKALARSDTFSGRAGKHRGTSGIWQRLPGGGLKLLFLYKPKVKYKGGQFKYYEAVEKEVKRVFNDHFTRGFKQAIKTARL